MHGWAVPPARTSVKSEDDFRREREEKVAELIRRGLLRSEPIREALLEVRREDFIPEGYRDYAYQEVPLPLPGATATISCPHSYPLFYEPLGLDRGHRFLEVGLGSGYGTALAREIVGPKGLVVSVEIDPDTLAFARANLERAGYRDLVLVQGDGALGWPDHAPYDRICVTAACERVPPPLLDQLGDGGRLIVPLVEGRAQVLTVLEKRGEEVQTTVICEVLYSDLRGIHGTGSPARRRSPPATDAGTATLVVTCSSLWAFRRARNALWRALPEARVRGAGFQGVVLVDVEGDPEEVAALVTRECAGAIGHATAVLAEVPSELGPLTAAAVQVGTERVGAGQSFAFRINKRRPHGYRLDTPQLERQVGDAIGSALTRTRGSVPRVDLTDPDVTVTAEVLGPVTLVGVVRKAWREDGG